MNEMIPLNQRLNAPDVLAAPTHPDVAEWRPIMLDDIDAIMPARAAMDRADHPDWVTARGDVVDDLTGSHVDVERDTTLAFGRDGEVVAYGVINLGQGQETCVQSHLSGGVHPDYRGRGIGRVMLDWQRRRSMQQLAGSDKALPGWSVLGLDEVNTAAQSLATRSGMRLARYFTGMERVVSKPIPEIPLPEGVRIVPFTPELSEVTRIAHNDAFRDHWGSQPMVSERWDSFVLCEEFRADLSFVAVASDSRGDDCVIAHGLTSVNEEDWVVQGSKSGYIALIGVVRDWRHQKLAPAILAAVLGGYRAAGLEKAILDVDSESPTGANALYERMLFTATTREVAYIAEY